MELNTLADVEVVGYNQDTVDDFLALNDVNVDKSLSIMPETLRSMFTELTFIGAAYLNPQTITRYEESIRDKYDFTTEANRFFYTTLVEMGKINNWKVSEYTVNAYMADNLGRMKQYEKFGGYNWIKFVIKMAEENEVVKNIDNYYYALKNYSLVREYWRRGMKEVTEKMVKTKAFKTMKPRDVFMTILSTLNRVYTTLANTEEMKDLTSGCEHYVLQKLQTPEQGIPFAFPMMTQIFQGIRLGQFMAWGMLSNAGKSRFLIREISNLAFVHKKKVLIISNEMTEEEMRACLITTTINNPDIQKLHKVEAKVIQNAIQNGNYVADKEFVGAEGVIDGYVTRLIGDDGKALETFEEYEARVEKMSQQYRDVKRIAQWIDKQMKKKIFILETGSDYSDADLKQIIENTCIAEDIKYVFYDTFKSDKSAMGDWSALKKTATILSEIAKKRNLFIGANIQLTDDAALIEPLELTSNNIANSKQIKHVLDALCLFREIPVADYYRYKYWTSLNDNPTKQELQDLSNDKRYYVCRIDKNRAGSKPDLLISLNLDTNVWTEEGRVGLYGQKTKKKTNSKGQTTTVTQSEWKPDQG